ncbi:hypothetical protein IPU75_05175 [Ochrobactrum sp. SD129]|nr:hypothetical protein [Ochrobactrum sp. SD129]
MAIVLNEPTKIDPYVELLYDIGNLIEEAALSNENVKPVELAAQIMDLIDGSGYMPEPVMASSTKISDRIIKVKNFKL